MNTLQQFGMFYADYRRLFVGQQHSVALTDHGELLVWGRSSFHPLSQTNLP
jgi:hypothetical protein